MFVSGGVDDLQAAVITAQLLFLESENPKREIAMYINSPGGIVTSGLAIYDTMQFVTCDVNTYCMGMAASMASSSLPAWPTNGDVGHIYPPVPPLGAAVRLVHER